MENNVLAQYCDMKKEVVETEERIERLRGDIFRLEEQIAKIEANETVRDCVKGGDGGIQTFRIEGVPTPELKKKRTDLLHKRLLLNDRLSLFELLKTELEDRTVEVEKYITDVEDSHMRRILIFRVVDGLPWEEVAKKMGDNSTPASVKMAYKRFLSTKM